MVAKDFVVTARLEVRPPVEGDRPRIVELFCDDDFMVFSSGSLTEVEANQRFDRMLALCEVVPFGKQPVVERASGNIVGYTGVDRFTFEGADWLEWGYRLVSESRCLGYATEASLALLRRARRAFVGEILAIIDPSNGPSQKVCRKLGFVFWKQAMVEGDARNLYRLDLRG